MDKKEKITFTKRQVAENWKCDPAIFDMEKNVFLASKEAFFEIITFGMNAVIRADETILDWCSEQFCNTLAQDIMDEDNLYLLDTKLRSFGKKLGGEHIRYLHLFPDKTVQKPSGFTYIWYRGAEIQTLSQYRKVFDNAFSPDIERDKLCFAAYDGDKIAAITGCDDYMDSLWQIGIDTLPSYRHRGLGAYLVNEMAFEIERNDKVAYYNTWSSNIASTRVALSTGFYPVWMGYPSESI